MKYRMLGGSGLRVSELCFGAMSFGSEWGYGSAEDDSRKCFDAFVEGGGNFFDTADNYTEGHSEKLLGKFLGAERDRFVVASKCTLASPMGPKYPGDPNATGNNRKHMMEAVDQTLKRLNTDYLDILYVHVWDFLTPVEEVMRTMDDLVRSGKVRYLGVSNTPAYIVARANTIAEHRGWTKFSVFEGQYNLLNRSIEAEVLPMARDLGMAVTCWQPLAASLLCGSEEEIQMRVNNGGMIPPDDSVWDVIRLVGSMAKDMGVSSAQVALNWLRQQPGVVIPILGVRLKEHVEDNLACLNWTLSDDQMQVLNDATTLTLAYPQLELAQVLIGMTYNLMVEEIDAPGRIPAYFEI